MPVLLLLLFWFGGLHSAPAQSPSHQTKPVPFDPSSQWLWTKEEWTTQGDAPLRAWREQFEARYMQTFVPVAVMEQYKQAALQAPQDRRKLFQWGYSAYLLYRREPERSTDLQLLRTLFKTKPPYSYEFMRMRYLVEVSQMLGNDQLTALGERLAKADPKDYVLRYYLSSSFRTDTPEGKRKELAYANELLQIDPNRSIGYAAVAHVYHTAWILSGAKDTASARLAVQNYQEYLKRELHPVRAGDRQLVQDIIDYLNKYIAKADKANAKN